MPGRKTGKTFNGSVGCSTFPSVWQVYVCVHSLPPVFPSLTGSNPVKSIHSIPPVYILQFELTPTFSDT